LTQTGVVVEIKSKAWQQNMIETRVHIEIEARYLFLLEIFKDYPALGQNLTLFLKELCNPMRNWHFLVTEGRKYCLDNLNILRSHPFGTRAVAGFIDIFHRGVESADTRETRQEAVDQLLQFLQRILREYGTDANTILPEINRSLVRMYQYEDDRFLLFVKSYYRLNRLAALLLKVPFPEKTQWQPLNRVLFRYHQMNCSRWGLEDDPLTAFEREAQEPELPTRVKTLFSPISHKAMEQVTAQLEKMACDNGFSDSATTVRLMEFPEFNHITSVYKDLPRQLLKAGESSRQGNHWKVIFLFQIINIPDLAMIHDATLKDINATLRWLIGHESSPYIRQLILQTFTILKLRSQAFPEATLNAILNMGKGVYNTGDSDLVKFFIQCVIKTGFQFPDIKGVGNNWQVKSNHAHLLNIRVWLELISLNPHWSMSLMSRLTIYLSICGVFIKDTDLFPRDITNLLNSPFEPVYNLLKQLTRLFPVYYNEIGAEGSIRDFSTRIDELTQRQDSLIHFYRKRIHVESSNRIITMTEAIFHFWETRDSQGLLPYVPMDFTEQISNDTRHLNGVHEILQVLVTNGIEIPRDLLTTPREELKSIIHHSTGPKGSVVDRERVMLLICLYRLLYQKYTPSCTEINQYLDHINTARIPQFNVLREALDVQKDPQIKTKARLQKLLSYLGVLKKELLSENRSEAREDIFKKRHFTADIPSLYGSYHEPKFDALGLTFRLESMVNPLFESLIEELDLNLITKVTVHKIRNRLRMFYTALKLDGISSSEYEFQMVLLTHSLEVQGFSFTQYLDIFQSLTKAVQNIMNDYFHTVHQEHLEDALERIPLDLLKEKYDTGDGLTNPGEQVAELFFRERMATSLGLQQLDLFLSKILTTLHQQAQELPQEHLQKLLMYDPKRIITSLTAPKSWILGAMDLGNKGNNLVTLSACTLPVPPGFIITTEAFRHRDLIDSYPPALANFREQILSALGGLEKTTGKTFGDPANPLLLSVRSGSVISQPGMMDTLIDVGINEEIAKGIADRTGNGWLAWDNYRRFLQCIGMIQGMKRDDFDAVILRFKNKWKLPYKSLFTGEQMKAVALAYRDTVKKEGIYFSNDPFKQLFQAILLVLDSWNAPRAKAYRQIIGISQDWGTSVTVQQMVFGNISSNAGTGVIITHDPRSPRNQISLWGDFTQKNQGEDVVAGLVNTFPISIAQQEREMRNTDTTLESHFPDIYNGLLTWADTLINKQGWSPQEIEFTFEGPHLEDLYILQSRDLGIRERKTRPMFNQESWVMAKNRYLGHGIGVSGGAMSGRLVFTLQDIRQWRTKEPESALILVRNDTVPDDIREIHAADGLLTARGGMTSHASIVAYRLDKTCVVGYRNMVCNERKKECRFDNIILTSGDFISIDGHKGTVLMGRIDIAAPGEQRK
jgi:pyruvate,orthophosphate dikinase